MRYVQKLDRYQNMSIWQVILKNIELMFYRNYMKINMKLCFKKLRHNYLKNYSVI